jgi:hypothetical protein
VASKASSEFLLSCAVGSPLTVGARNFGLSVVEHVSLARDPTPYMLQIIRINKKNVGGEDVPLK